MIAVAFYHQSQMNLSVRKLSSSQSDEDQLTLKIEEYNESVEGLKEKYDQLIEDLEDEDVSYADLEDFKDRLDTDFNEDKIDALKAEYTEIKDDERTSADLASIDLEKIEDEIRDIRSDLLAEENRELKKELKAEKCDSYNTLADLYDIIGAKLKDKESVLASIERENSPVDYMSFYMQKMFERQMMVNPMANMFGMNASPFSRELLSIQYAKTMGFISPPSIFDYSDQVFNLPSFNFPNVNSDRQLSNRLGYGNGFNGGGSLGFEGDGNTVVNNYYYGNNEFRSPSQFGVPGLDQRSMGPAGNPLNLGGERGSLLQNMPQMIPQWNRGNGNVEIFSQRPESA